MKSKKTLIFSAIGIGVAVVVAIKTVRFCTPQSIMGSLDVSFSSVTNEAGNVSVTVTNCSRWQTTYWPRIEVKEFGLWPPYPNNVALDDLAKPRKISPYASDFILVSPPTNVSAWRLWVDYRADTERNKAVHKAQAFFEKIHLEGLSSKIIPWDLGGYVLLPKSDEPLNREAEIDKGSCGPKMARGATTP